MTTTTGSQNATAGDGAAIGTATVADVMHAGVMTCDPGASLRDVASVMATHHLHCVAMMGVSAGRGGETLTWKIVSDVDAVSAGLRGGADQPAKALAGRPINSVEPRMPLAQAAKLMLADRTSHLVVVDPDTQHPIGVLSTLDIVGSIGRTNG